MRLALPLAGLALALAGCAPATRVILLPQSDGQASAVQVQSGQSTTTLNQAYDSAVLHTAQALQTEQLSPQAVNRRYSDLLAAAPLPPRRFVLHFELGETQLTADSMNELTEVLFAANLRPGGEIVVIGHTDRVGTQVANDFLSRQRAAAIRELLIANGFDPRRVDAVGRGEREPLIPTEDNVPEPRNRRAEILVR